MLELSNLLWKIGLVEQARREYKRQPQPPAAGPIQNPAAAAVADYASPQHAAAQGAHGDQQSAGQGRKNSKRKRGGGQDGGEQQEEAQQKPAKKRGRPPKAPNAVAPPKTPKTPSLRKNRTVLPATGAVFGVEMTIDMTGGKPPAPAPAPPAPPAVQPQPQSQPQSQVQKQHGAGVPAPTRAKATAPPQYLLTPDPSPSQPMPMEFNEPAASPFPPIPNPLPQTPAAQQQHGQGSHVASGLLAPQVVPLQQDQQARNREVLERSRRRAESLQYRPQNTAVSPRPVQSGSSSNPQLVQAQSQHQMGQRTVAPLTRAQQFRQQRQRQQQQQQQQLFSQMPVAQQQQPQLSHTSTMHHQGGYMQAAMPQQQSFVPEQQQQQQLLFPPEWYGDTLAGQMQTPQQGYSFSSSYLPQQHTAPFLEQQQQTQPAPFLQQGDELQAPLGGQFQFQQTHHQPEFSARPPQDNAAVANMMSGSRSGSYLNDHIYDLW